MQEQNGGARPDTPQPSPHASTPSPPSQLQVKRIVSKKKVVKPKPEPSIVYLVDPRKRLGRDYQTWTEGSLVVTPELKKRYKVARRIDDGHAGVVFKVINKKGKLFALKVPKKDTEKQFRKLHQEVEKNKQLADLSLPYAEIVEEGGDYLVKEWIEGIRGDEWFMRWNSQGRPFDDEPWKQLIGMFDRLSARGIYVQNLKDLNVIWDGSKWVVIDVGYFKYDMKPEEALGRYYETFDTRWNKPKYNRPRGPYRYNCPTIAEIRGQGPECYIKRPAEVIAKKRSRMLARKLKAQQEAQEGLNVVERLQSDEKLKVGSGSSNSTAVQPSSTKQETSKQQQSEVKEKKEEDVSAEEKGSESGEKTEPKDTKQKKVKPLKEGAESEEEGSEKEAEKGEKKATKKKTKKKKPTKKKTKKAKRKKEEKDKEEQAVKLVSITTDEPKKSKKKKKPAKKKRKKDKAKEE